MNRVALLVPGRIDGATMTAGTWFVDPNPSSHTIMTEVRPARYVVLATIRLTTAFSHASPVATEQSCVSWHRFGVTNENAGKCPAARSEQRQRA